MAARIREAGRFSSYIFHRDLSVRHLLHVVSHATQSAINVSPRLPQPRVGRHRVVRILRQTAQHPQSSLWEARLWEARLWETRLSDPRLSEARLSAAVGYGETCSLFLRVVNLLRV